MNASKNELLPEEDRRYHYIQGTKSINLAFKANQKNSAAANALCELLLRKGQSEKVSNGPDCFVSAMPSSLSYRP